MRERRRLLRISIQAPAVCRILPQTASDEISEPFGATLRDLSMGGVSLNTKRILVNLPNIERRDDRAPRRHLYLHCPLPSRKAFRAIGETIWQRKGRSNRLWGLQFLGFIEGDWRDLKNYLEPILGEQPPPFADSERLRNAYCWVYGRAQGDPGPAGIGIVLKRSNGEILTAVSRYAGRLNQMMTEHQALMAALVEAKKLNVRRLVVYTDSLLIRVQAEECRKMGSKYTEPLHKMVAALINTFDEFRLLSIPTARNMEAKNLARLAILNERQAPIF